MRRTLLLVLLPNVSILERANWTTSHYIVFLELAPAFLYPVYLTLCKVDITPRAAPRGVRLRKSWPHKGFLWKGQLQIEITWINCIIAPAPPRKTRGELYKDVDADYYGYRDEDDGVLVPLEQDVEREGWFS